MILALPGLATALSLFIPRNSQHRYRIKKSAQQLRRKGLITTSFVNGAFKAKITPRGKKEAQLLLLEKTGCPTQKKWDGKWHTVLFDIPEKHKSARNAISILLRKIGFASLQRSVFVYPYECRKEVHIVISYFKVQQYVHYAVINQIDNDTKLRKYFNLS